MVQLCARWVLPLLAQYNDHYTAQHNVRCSDQYNYVSYQQYNFTKGPMSCGRGVRINFTTYKNHPAQGPTGSPALDVIDLTEDDAAETPPP